MSSFIVSLQRKVEVVARDPPQDHLLDPIQIDEVVFEGNPYALDEGFGGVVAKELMQLAHRAKRLPSVPRPQAIDER
jgi:hypothetical protein